MSQSLYKSTLNFLKIGSKNEIKGNHLRRLNVLACMISSCLCSKKSSFEGLSNADKESCVQSESRIKQSKRWLLSKWTDWNLFYAPYVKPLLESISKEKEIKVIIDGSEMAGDCVVLMISVIWQKRAIPLVWLTKKGEKGHFPEKDHIQLIELAKKILPLNCRIILLGDGEFDGKDLREKCKEFNWEYVLRTSKDRKINCGGEIAQIGMLAPENYGVVFVENALNGDNALIWHKKRYPEPIPLITNMELGEMATQYYAFRFKIELLFKQLKSAGFNVQQSKIQGETKISNLIIVLALAFILTFCAGLLMKKQENSVLNSFIRADRKDQLLPNTIALKAISNNFHFACTIFSQITKSYFSDFFAIT